MQFIRRHVCVLYIVVLITVFVIYELNQNLKPIRNFHYVSFNISSRVIFIKDTNTTIQRKLLVPTSQTESTAPVYTFLSFDNFSYPLDVDMVKLVQAYRQTGEVKHRVINPFTWPYLHNPRNTCLDTSAKFQNHMEDVFLLFVVKSKYDNLQQRIAIRQTWGNMKYLKDVTVKTVFVLGTPVYGSFDYIWDEIKQFNDIILMDFHDTYFNNTLKTSTLFNWVHEFCPKAHFIVSIDDDIFVSLKTLVRYLNQLPPKHRTNLYMGRLFDGYEPHRSNASKWHVPVSEYPWTKYPPFIAGGTVIMTMDFVSDVQIAMRHTKHFRLDDVYLAIIAYKLGVKPVQDTGIYGYRTSSLTKFVLSAQGYTPSQLKQIWKQHNRFLTTV
ncbi:beta-1,3-galactosyltransferase 1-like [Argopecten irradians]|uniref:beta-1,3-galactosyltransferase 1-like n=1 Tax=Argopecten irradians TaxID=31199 RepID=UPI003718CA2C